MASLVMDNVADSHQTDSDADIVDSTGTTEVKLTKHVSKCPSRKVVEYNECNDGHIGVVSIKSIEESTEIEVLLEAAVKHHIEAKQLPDELIINTPVSTSSSKTDDSTLLLNGVSSDTSYLLQGNGRSQC